MHISKKVLCGITLLFLLLQLCTSSKVTRSESSTMKECPPVHVSGADTLSYAIAFPENDDRDQFIGSFKEFLDKYPFTVFRGDSASGSVVIRLMPVVAGSTAVGTTLGTIEYTRFTESALKSGKWDTLGLTTPGDSLLPLPVFIDTIIPVIGGKLRLHSQRAGIDGTFLPLVTVDPFRRSDSTEQQLLSVVSVEPKKVTVQINGRLVDGTGRLVSALDLIEVWTGYVKRHPAEGLALFRHVQGVLPFIQGREAVIRGFGAVDKKTCYLRLSRPDTLAAARIVSPRICGSINSRFGVYFPVKTTAGFLLLVANSKTGRRTALLDTLVFSVAEDQNPILSFSLKKYDVITLTSKSDISYARSTLGKQATLHPLPPDRYFVACNIDDIAMRRYIRFKLNASELLRTIVKAEGEPIAAIENDSLLFDIEPVPENISPPAGRTVRILFRKDDDVSRKVAEKLLADLSGKGVRSSLVAAGVKEYERTLIERNYECAVGWVPDLVRSDTSERLRLATIWFDDENREEKRLASLQEVPLFAVNRYLLLRKPAGIYRNAVERIFASSEPIVSGEDEHGVLPVSQQKEVLPLR